VGKTYVHYIKQLKPNVKKKMLKKQGERVHFEETWARCGERWKGRMADPVTDSLILASQESNEIWMQIQTGPYPGTKNINKSVTYLNY
jgi:hypothetical protein